MARGRAPFLARLVHQRGYLMTPMCAGLPTSTPAFQLAAMYGVRPDIPGFHYHDKRRKSDVYFPRGGDAAHVEQTQAAGRRGIVSGGGTYGCVFTGGAASNLLTFAMIKRPTGAGLVRTASKLVVIAWVLIKGTIVSAVEVVRALLRMIADPVSAASGSWKWLAIKIGISVWLRELFTLAVAHDIYTGVSTIYINYLDYDVAGHAWGPRHPRALQALHRVDASIQRLWRVLRRVPEHRYDLYVLSDHGQAETVPYLKVAGGRPIEQSLFDDFFSPDLTAAGSAPEPRRVGLVRGFEALRAHRAPGFFQRFVNYLEQDFPWVLGARARSASTTASASSPPDRMRSSISWRRRSRCRWSASRRATPGWPRASRPRRASGSCWHGRRPARSASGAVRATASTHSAPGRSPSGPISSGSSRASAI